MPRFYPSIPFDACYGSVGNRTYYHWKGVPYYKKKAFTDFPGTPAQLEQAAAETVSSLAALPAKLAGRLLSALSGLALDSFRDSEDLECLRR